MLENFLFAVSQILSPANLLLLITGGIGGIIVGCLPGLTATMALALLVPFTFTMEATSGLIMLGGLYVGAMFGDAIPATLINTPGTPSAIATTFDGYPLAKKGLAQQALITNAFSSLCGGVIGTIVLLTLSPPLSELGLKFGPPEYFWMAIFGLTIIGTLASDSILKGFTAGALGLLLSTVGISPIAGDVRFTLGLPSLQAGIDLMVALIGFFCIPQILEMVETGAKEYHILQYRSERGIFWKTIRELVAKPVLLIRSALIGVGIGIIPGAGGNIASLVSYNEAVRWSKHPEEFGKGTLEGIAATESANCSVVQGSLIPMLTLGIPGSPAAAVILGALLLHGMRPGRELYTTFGDITHTFILSFFLGVVVMFILTSLGSKYFARMISVPFQYLVPAIVFLSIIGSYAIRNNLLDVTIMFLFGLGGYLLRKLGFHSGPLVLGLIMGPFAEQGLVQSLLIGKASGSVLKVMFGRPLSLVLIVLSIISILWPIVSAWRTRSVKEKKKEEEEYNSVEL
ncbi:MAG: tripartite tricarboxylate transporter permease [Firmicutes bacterium]|nr:tripartite tricarboxylate transporter permease [Bacillota bacterium]